MTVGRRAFLTLVAAAPLAAVLKPWRSPTTWTLTFPHPVKAVSLVDRVGAAVPLTFIGTDENGRHVWVVPKGVDVALPEPIIYGSFP